jgi:hypothetical protein
LSGLLFKRRNRYIINGNALVVQKAHKAPKNLTQRRKEAKAQSGHGKCLDWLPALASTKWHRPRIEAGYLKSSRLGVLALKVFCMDTAKNAEKRKEDFGREGEKPANRELHELRERGFQQTAMDWPRKGTKGA